MKNYTIAILPDKETAEIIENFRLNIIGKKLVDSMQPHVTFKRRFTLNDGFSEEDLIKNFQSIQLPKFEVDFSEAKMLGNVLALIGKSPKLSAAHTELVKYLNGKVSTQNPEWEMENYTIHLTLLRGVTQKVISPIINHITFDRASLYEIDPYPTRSYVNELSTISLGKTIK